MLLIKPILLTLFLLLLSQHNHAAINFEHQESYSSQGTVTFEDESEDIKPKKKVKPKADPKVIKKTEKNEISKPKVIPASSEEIIFDENIQEEQILNINLEHKQPELTFYPPATTENVKTTEKIKSNQNEKVKSMDLSTIAIYSLSILMTFAIALLFKIFKKQTKKKKKNENK